MQRGAPGGTHHRCVGIAVFAIRLAPNRSPDLLKLMPRLLRVTNALAQLRRHIHRMHLAFGLADDTPTYNFSVVVDDMDMGRRPAALPSGVDSVSGANVQYELRK
jgi:hypothetical protein